MYNKINKIVSMNLIICSLLGLDCTDVSAKSTTPHFSKGIIKIINNKKGSPKRKKRVIPKPKKVRMSLAQWFQKNRKHIIASHDSPSLLIDKDACHLFHEGEGDSIGNTTTSESNGASFMNNIESFSKSYREGWIIARAKYVAYTFNSKNITASDYQKAINQYNAGFKLTSKHRIMFTAGGKKLKGPGVGAVSTNGYHWSYLRD